MSDNTLWARFYTAIAAVIIVITISISGYNHNKNVLLVEALKTSQNPIATACAMDNFGDSSARSVCSIMAAKQ